MKPQTPRIAALLALLTLPLASAYPQSADEIIRRVDANQKFTTQKYKVEMEIRKGSRTLVKEFYGYGAQRGEKSYMEFTNPEDKGVKYLKIGDELWIYFPEADDIMKISGHMLRKGMMGSDISYEDMTRAEDFEKQYEVKLLGSETIRGHSCHVIELMAKTPDALYERRLLYIDKSRYAAVKIEMYAKGGRLIKTMELYDFFTASGRYLPRKIVIQDKRKSDTATTITFVGVEFDADLPSGVFTHSYLKR